MTKEAKQERRIVRRKLYQAIRRNHFSLQMRMRMTPAQLKSAIRVVADELISGRNPLEYQPL